MLQMTWNRVTAYR